MLISPVIATALAENARAHSPSPQPQKMHLKKTAADERLGPGALPIAVAKKCTSKKQSLLG